MTSIREELQKRATVTVKDFSELQGKTTVQALKQLKELEEKGYVERIGSSRIFKSNLYTEHSGGTNGLGITPPLQKGFDKIRKTLKYYAEVAQLAASSKLRVNAKDERDYEKYLSNQVLHSVDWDRMARGESAAIPRDKFTNQTVWGQSNTRQVFAGPFELVEQRFKGEKVLRWLPVFLVETRYNRRATAIEFNIEGAIKINRDWLKHHFKSHQSHLEEDLLIQLGFLAEENGEQQGIRVDNLKNCIRRLKRAMRFRKDWRDAGSTEAVKEFDFMRHTRENKLGIYTVITSFPEVLSRYDKNLVKDIRAISEANDEQLSKSSLPFFFHGIAKSDDSVGVPAVAKLLHSALNTNQELALENALTRPVVTLQGPPGTGKSTVVRSTILSSLLRGDSVLFGSTKHVAIASVAEPLKDTNLLIDAYKEVKNKKALAARLKRGFETNGVDSKNLSKYKEDLERLGEEIKSIETEIEELHELREESSRREIEMQCASQKLGGNWVSDSSKLSELISPINLLRVLGYQLSDSDDGECGRFGYAYSKEIVSLKHNNILFEYIYRIISCCRKFILRRSVSKMLPEYDLETTCKELAEATIKQEDYQEILDCVKSRSSLDDLNAKIKRKKIQQQEISEKATKELPDHLNKVLRDRIRQGDGLQDHIVGAITCSLKSVPSRIPMEPGVVGLGIIDEAAACHLYDLIPLLYRSERIFVIGDPMQLPPVGGGIALRDDRNLSDQYQIEKTYQAFGATGYTFGEIATCEVSDVPFDNLMLTEHYRCHPVIAELFSKHFYDGKLVVRTGLSSKQKVSVGVKWTDAIGECVKLPDTPGLYCEENIEQVVLELERLSENNFQGTVGVTTPFRQQQRHLEKAVSQRISSRQLEKWDFACLTIHSFQGDEKDVMIFSLPGGGEAGTPPFYKNPNSKSLWNVAISRGRLLLHVVGDLAWALDSEIPILKSLAEISQEDVAQNKTFRSDLVGPVWEPLFAETLQEHGIKFEQQHRALGFYLDFAIFSKDGRKLNLEVDGETYHRGPDGRLRKEDLRRDLQLQLDGWVTKRFWVYELKEDLEKCIHEIKELITQ